MPPPSQSRPVRFTATLALLAVLWTGISVAGSARAAAPIPLQLNKLEALAEGGTGCRAYFVVSNPDTTPIQQLRLDLVVFGTDGVIARRVALDFGPLSAGKTAVRPFDLPDLACDSIGHVLANDVLSCQVGGQASGSQGTAPADQERQGCLERLTVSSRAKAELTK